MEEGAPVARGGFVLRFLLAVFRVFATCSSCELPLLPWRAGSLDFGPTPGWFGSVLNAITLQNH